MALENHLTFDPRNTNRARNIILNLPSIGALPPNKKSAPPTTSKTSKPQSAKGGHFGTISHCFCGIAAIRHSRNARLFSCSFSAVTCHTLRHSPSHVRRPILGASVTSHVTPPIGCDRCDGVTVGWRCPSSTTWRRSQACVIGYLARISPIRFKAPSAATSGVMFWRITLACAEPQICAAFASAQPGLKT